VKPVLEVQDLRIERGNTVILDEVSWRVEKGQHWVILGANGSGKTTLLSALSGYFCPTEGEITVLGKTYGEYDWRELRKEIGLVSSALRQMMANEERAIESVVSGKKAMLDYRERIKTDERRKAMRLLKQVECEHLAMRPWMFLSQGERQRVLIGRALMGDPKLLILDEPCAGLDPAAREHFLQFTQRLGEKKSAPTLILVTHHVEEIMPVFSHVIMFRDGKVLVSGQKRKALNSKNITDAFEMPVKLKTSGGRHRLEVDRL
jgi:iron complex transport system ATP-binding protein